MDEYIELNAAIAKIDPDEYYHSNEVKDILRDVPAADVEPLIDFAELRLGVLLKTERFHKSLRSDMLVDKAGEFALYRGLLAEFVEAELRDNGGNREGKRRDAHDNEGYLPIQAHHKHKRADNRDNSREELLKALKKPVAYCVHVVYNARQDIAV